MLPRFFYHFDLSSVVAEKEESLNLLRYQAFVAEEEGFEPP
jgi:hypothetical protein